jgi:hypothetical protein
MVALAAHFGKTNSKPTTPKHALKMCMMLRAWFVARTAGTDSRRAPGTAEAACTTLETVNVG